MIWTFILGILVGFILFAMISCNKYTSMAEAIKRSAMKDDNSMAKQVMEEYNI